MTEQELKNAGLQPYCPCGSGLYRNANHDGYGIFLTYTCDKCHKEKMSRFRSDILDHYETDETIEEGDY